MIDVRRTLLAGVVDDSFNMEQWISADRTLLSQRSRLMLLRIPLAIDTALQKMRNHEANNE
jgi:hypothetical protein